jgi:hypothetical protein
MNRATKRLKTSVTEFLHKPNPISAAGLRSYRTYRFMRERIIPSRRLARQEDQEFDVRHGVKTAGRVSIDPARVIGENGAFAVHYEAVRPLFFRKALAYFDLRFEDFTFIDFGSGMGRALLMASEYPFKRIMGVEFSPDLHQIAEDNIRRYKSESQKCCDIRSICTDAAQFVIPPDMSMFYFFNPFSAEVMEKVLFNIHRSLQEFPRELYFIYLNPRAIELFDQFEFDRSHLFSSFKY